MTNRINKCALSALIALFVMLNCLIASGKLANYDIPCLAKIDTGYGVGVKKQTVNASMNYCAFLGVPYAQPPIGNLRFEPPKSLRWNDARYFHKTQNSCPQRDDAADFAELIGHEDCLYLNVYTPKVDVKKSNTKDYLRPVLFWIHGGSFFSGSSETDIFGPDFLVENDILVVTFNYRLDILGFLAIPELNITGNFGLKDQVVALKWVQRNIKHFGGDPKRVTICGWSAGGASVTYHMYSKASKGLFHQAISMSGVMIEPWAYFYNPSDFTSQIYKFFNTRSKEKLKEMDMTQLFRKTDRYKLELVFLGMFISVFNPVSEEKTHTKSRHFITKSPIEMVQEPPVNDVPMMIGYTATELEEHYNQMKFIMSGYNYPNQNDRINEVVMHFMSTYPEKHQIINRNEFFSNILLEADILYGIKYFINELLKFTKNSVYLYQFEYEGKFGYAKPKILEQIGKTRPMKYGAAHGDELGYIFTPYNFNETALKHSEFIDEIQMLQKTVNLWSNFIKFGNPTPKKGKDQVEWSPYNANNSSMAKQYLSIDKKMKMVKQEWEDSIHHKLWDLVFKCLYFFKCDHFK